MHYRIRYMQVKYQLNRDKRFVKNVNTKNKLNCINLHLPIAIFKNRCFQTCIIVKRTCISIFSKIGLVDQPKLHTNLFAKNKLNCINLHLPIAIFKNRCFQTCIIVKRTCISIFSKIGLVDQPKLHTNLFAKNLQIA